MNSLNQNISNTGLYNNGLYNNGMNYGFNPTPTQGNFGGMNAYNLPHYNIIQVNGQKGAETLQMAPNSKVLLLDETDPLIWFVQTDGAGYKTVTPYSITPYQPAPPVDLNSLEQRLSILEEKINAKSYSGTNKQRKQNSRNEQYVSVETADTTSQASIATNNEFK